MDKLRDKSNNIANSIDLSSLKGPVAIVGMAKSGESAKNFLKLARPDLQVFSFDQKLPNVDFSDPALLAKAEPKTLVVSPGVPLSLPWLQDLKEAGALITSELSLAASIFSTEKIIAVTGSVGKSTSVSVLGAGVASFSKNYFVGGNLGTPICDYAIEKLKTGKTAEWMVLELSSYQLENCAGLKPEVSAIVSLSPNHLERYKSLEHYYHTKWHLTEITKGKVVLNQYGYDLMVFAKMQSNFPDKFLVTDKASEFCKSLPWRDRVLLGEHNKENILLASLIAKEANWPEQSYLAMMKFAGLAHRLENLGSKNGVLYINDSKATALDSVAIAVGSASEAVAKDSKLFVMLGGRDKNLPWEQLKQIEKPNRSFVFFGECASVAKTKSQLSGPEFKKMSEAFDFISSQAKSGDVVLLSPGGTSLDEFKNFEERGDELRRLFHSKS